MLGRNIIRTFDILYVGANCLRLPLIYGKRDTLGFVDYEHHIYFPLKLVDMCHYKSLSTATLAGFGATGTDKILQTSMSWSRMKRVIDSVHEHTCGHA